jgi:hypothetical protein
MSNLIHMKYLHENPRNGMSLVDNEIWCEAKTHSFVSVLYNVQGTDLLELVFQFFSVRLRSSTSAVFNSASEIRLSRRFCIVPLFST